MIFELIGQVEPVLIPVSVGLLVAYWCLTGVSMTLFDVVIEFKNFPYMPSLSSVQSYNLKASDLMNPNCLFMTLKSRMAEIPVLLMQTGE